jgi:hypothetical protein
MLRSGFLFLILFFLIFNLSGQSNPVIKSADFTSMEILKFLLDGSFDNRIQAQKWKAPRKTWLYTDENSIAYTAIDTILTFTQASIEKKLVISKTLPLTDFGYFDQCAGCAPCIGLALFTKNEDGDGFELEFFNPMVDVFGQAGLIPTPRIIEVGLNHHVVAFRGEVSWDEGMEKWFELKNNFPLFFSYKYFFANQSFEETQNITAIEQEARIQKTENEYYDIELTRSTYNPENDPNGVNKLIKKIYLNYSDAFGALFTINSNYRFIGN